MKLVFILIAAFLYSYCYSQGISVPKDSLNELRPKRSISKIELLGGPNILYPKVYSKDLSPGDGINWGYSFGVNFIHPIRKRIDLVAGILYERKRFKNKISNSSQFFEGEMKNDYLTVSLAPRYSFLRDHFHIGLGAYFAILQKSMATTIYKDLNSGTSVYSTKSSYSLNHKYDAGLTVALGYTCSINKRILFNCQIMNNNGVKAVSNTPPLSSSLSFERNNNISLLIGISLKR